VTIQIGKNELTIMLRKLGILVSISSILLNSTDLEKVRNNSEKLSRTLEFLEKI
jgi:hypothetical protein